MSVIHRTKRSPTKKLQVAASRRHYAVTAINIDATRHLLRAMKRDTGLPRLFDRPKYRQRNIIECMLGELKENRRIVTRFDGHAKKLCGHASHWLVPCSVCHIGFRTAPRSWVNGCPLTHDLSISRRFRLHPLPRLFRQPQPMHGSCCPAYRPLPPKAAHPPGWYAAWRS